MARESNIGDPAAMPGSRPRAMEGAQLILKYKRSTIAADGPE
jgi:hypothetical protein